MTQSRISESGRVGAVPPDVSRIEPSNGAGMNLSDPETRPLADQIYADALVWDKIAEALRNPQLLTKEYAHLQEEGLSARDSDRLKELDREIVKMKKRQDRNLDLYVEGEIDKSTLKQRQEKLRGQKASLEREREAVQKKLSYTDTDIESFAQFCQAISERLDDVSFEEKRQIFHLLNIEGRVKDRAIILTGCIPGVEAGECFPYSMTHQGVVSRTSSFGGLMCAAAWADDLQSVSDKNLSSNAYEEYPAKDSSPSSQ